MLLHAVFVPPRPLLDAITQVVQSFDTPATVAPEPPQRRLGRRGRRDVQATPSEAGDPELELVPHEQLNLPIAGFGNVTSGDARRLADVLHTAAASWSCPTVRFAGGGALEFPGDRAVWAKLDGDVGALKTVASGVTKSVESCGFYVDRRIFRPSLAVATITGATTPPYLEGVVAALDAFQGEAWTVEYVSVTTPSFDPTLAAPREMFRIPLAAA